MNGYNFTDGARKVLAMARAEAFHYGHEYVGTEHILLGLIREEDGMAAATLQVLRVDFDVLRGTIESVFKVGQPRPDPRTDLPYTSRSKAVLSLAMTEARELSHSYVGTEHVLLGLLREEKGIGAQVLIDAGVTLANARAEVLRLLHHEPPAEELSP